MDPAAVSGRKPANLRSLCTLSPANPQAWNYVCDATDAALALDVVSERLLYVGHSHLAFICAAAEEVHTVFETETDSVELVRILQRERHATEDP